MLIPNISAEFFSYLKIQKIWMNVDVDEFSCRLIFGINASSFSKGLMSETFWGRYTSINIRMLQKVHGKLNWQIFVLWQKKVLKSLHSFFMIHISMNIYIQLHEVSRDQGFSRLLLKSGWATGVQDSLAYSLAFTVWKSTL